MARARFSQRKDRYSRGRPKREPGATLRITYIKPDTLGMEGYLELVANSVFDLKRPLVQTVEVDNLTAEGGACALVDMVVEQKRTNARATRKNRDQAIEVDEWWVILDAGYRIGVEQRKRLNEAIELAKGSGVHVVLDDPSFEYWGLLHTRYSSEVFDSREDVVQTLKSDLAISGCELTVANLRGRLGSALMNAEALRANMLALRAESPHIDYDIILDRLAQLAEKTSYKAYKIPSVRGMDHAALLKSEPGRRAASIYWRGLKLAPGRVSAYEIRLFDTVVVTFSVAMDMKGKRTCKVADAIENKRLLPLSFAKGVNEDSLVEWFQTRTVLHGQEYAIKVLESFGLDSEDVFGQIQIGLGLTLTDGYWVAPQGLMLTWADVNIFDSGVDDMLSVSIYDPEGAIDVDGSSAFISPMLGAGGSFKKAWSKLNGGYVLRKSGTPRMAANDGQEPWSEYVAAQVADALGLPHVSYGLELYHGEIVSTCKLLNDGETALVPSYLVVGEYGNDFRSTLAAYAALGEDALEAFCDMIVFDALICNTDRHAGNYGFLRDNKSGMIMALAPLFDHNYSLFARDMASDYDEWRSGKRVATAFRCEPRLDNQGKAMTFDEQVAFVMGNGQRDMLRRFLSTSSMLKNVENGAAVPHDRLEAWQDYLAARAHQLLQIPLRDEREFRQTLSDAGITRDDLPAAKLGILGDGPLSRANPVG